MYCFDHVTKIPRNDMDYISVTGVFSETS